MAALTLLIIGKYFLPIFIEKNIYTIPDFVEKRFSIQLKSILAVFWIALYVFVNISSVLYLGALALNTIMGIEMIYAIIGLSLFAAAYSLYGGLSSIAWTDTIQVVFLIFGGLVTTYLALNTVSNGAGMIEGFSLILNKAPEKFNMILDKSNPEYVNLPGIGVLIGGLWVANLYYWGFNQYIIQRALAAKSLKDAQKGIVFAAFLKILIPFIIVIPGIAAFVIVNDPELLATLGAEGLLNLPTQQTSDKAYPWLIQFLPAGLKGLAFVALIAAIVSSLASMLNSTATIFTMDIYKKFINPNSDDENLVKTGRITSAIALLIGAIIAPLLGGISQAFQFIQEYTGIVSPGILAVFVLGLFWKKTTNKAAIWGVLCSIPVAMFFKIGPKEWLSYSSINYLFPKLPFLDQMGYTTLITMLIMIVLSYAKNKNKNDPKHFEFNKQIFETSKSYTIFSFAILLILVFLYALFW
jgi:SSS family solute:Na+ symporter